VAVEDFCQLSELLTESKYNTSTEKAGKIILKYSANVGLDMVTFFDLILFSFLTGNSDMHLKNFSLMRNTFNEMVLAPFYNLLSTKLIFPEDEEEVALTINGKKSKLKKNDFLMLGKNLKIEDKAINKCFERAVNNLPKMKDTIKHSFLPKNLKKEHSELIDERINKLI